MIHINITDLGPIKRCSMDVSQFSVLMGPQASGKSTIAKVVYFFLTIKDDFVAQFTAVEPEYEQADQNATTCRDLKKRLRNKFLGIFGTSWIMPDDMNISCEYCEGVRVAVFLEKSKSNAYPTSKNYVNFRFSDDLKAVINQNDVKRRFAPGDQESAKKFFIDLFQEPYDVIYIPAGREMMTLLSDRLAYIFTDPDVTGSRGVDYCTQSFVRLVLKLRGLFDNGTEGLLNDKLHLTTEKVDRPALEKMQRLTDQILKGRYVCVNGEERILLKAGKYVKLNYASSGQQEAAWVLNILFYYMMQNRSTFLILEEPESHLYPSSQDLITQAIAMFCNYGNQVMMTTHSPYILGALNNCLYASQIRETEERSHIVDDACVISPDHFEAWFVENGGAKKAMTDGLIDNSLIDGASDVINEKMDRLTELYWEEQDNGK